MNTLNKKNACWMLLYAVLYALMTALVCVLGSIHPLLFVCYQITAGILLSGIVTASFDRIRAPGAAACLSLGVLILLLVIGDAVLWHVVPLIVIAALAELVRAISKYGPAGDVIGAVIMSFSTFGYYGQIWFNRAYTYECAAEEMPAGYADTLMTLSPAWALFAVAAAGILLSVVISNVTLRIFCRSGTRSV
ncbi:MAG: Trep_Strep domain-containing protein [Ruminococcaceae bacterium]|jgi:hypothetical protein|nr:Trep_Strep domain-containing protein [Oscillospiraceae bacterium]